VPNSGLKPLTSHTCPVKQAGTKFFPAQHVSACVSNSQRAAVPAAAAFGASFVSQQETILHLMSLAVLRFTVFTRTAMRTGALRPSFAPPQAPPLRFHRSLQTHTNHVHRRSHHGCQLLATTECSSILGPFLSLVGCVFLGGIFLRIGTDIDCCNRALVPFGFSQLLNNPKLVSDMHTLIICESAGGV
jgi:hypothetical protein